MDAQNEEPVTPLLSAVAGGPFGAAGIGGPGIGGSAALLPAAPPAQVAPARLPVVASGAEVLPAAAAHRCPPAPGRHTEPLPPPPEVPHCIMAALRGGWAAGPSNQGDGSQADGSTASSSELHPALAQAHALLAAIKAVPSRPS